MPAWKVLLIGLMACICMGLATATFIIPLDQQGSQRWVWMGGLLVATLVAGALFARYLKHAGTSLDTKPGWTRR